MVNIEKNRGNEQELLNVKTTLFGMFCLYRRGVYIEISESYTGKSLPRTLILS